MTQMHNASACSVPLESRPVRVLVADDALDNRKLVEFFLGNEGIEVESVINGEQAVERVRTSQNPAQAFDVLLMDMQMPVMDGYEATRAIRALGATFPIIAMTGSSLDQEKDKCFDAGCTDFLSKPFNFALLVEKIRELTSV